MPKEDNKANSPVVSDTSEKIILNIYDKIQTAKKMLNDEKIKKSGLNKFSNFQYYELSDFMPNIIKIFDELKLFSKVVFTNELAVLTIVNADNPAEQEEYTSPMKDLEIKGANAMQTLGGIETYQRRYLYMSALDITENDMLDPDNEKEEMYDLSKHNIIKIKERFEQTITKLMSKNLSLKDICEKLKIDEEQFSIYMKHFGILDKLEKALLKL